MPTEKMQWQTVIMHNEPQIHSSIWEHSGLFRLKCVMAISVHKDNSAWHSFDQSPNLDFREKKGRKRKVQNHLP